MQCTYQMTQTVNIAPTVEQAEQELEGTHREQIPTEADYSHASNGKDIFIVFIVSVSRVLRRLHPCR